MLRQHIQGLQDGTLDSLHQESLAWERDGSLPDSAIARLVHGVTMSSVSFTLFSVLLFAEVWRELYVRCHISSTPVAG